MIHVGGDLLAWAATLPPGEKELAEKIIAQGAASKDAVLACLLEMGQRETHENAWEHFNPTREVNGRRHEKQIQAMRMQAEKRFLGLMWGNRVGKSIWSAYQTSRHVCGEYPDWWDGLRFNYPITAYAAATSRAKQLEVVQPHLIGKPGRWGEGCFIPKNRIVKVRMNRTVPDTVEAVEVAYGRNGNEGISTLMFRTYEQGRRAFESVILDWFWGDEEPPEDVFEEAKMRLVGNLWRAGGHMLLSFTPLMGMTKVCRLFLYNDTPLGDGLASDQVGCISASWEDNPYLPPDEVAMLIANTPERERQARQHGYPIVGEAALFQLPRTDYEIPWFDPPKVWPFGAGMDHGWRHPTAVAWGTRDPSSDIMYSFKEWRRSEAELAVVRDVLQTEGRTYPIFADKTGMNKRQESSGKSLFDLYAELGVYLLAADNDLEPGILEMQTALRNGKWKIMSTCAQTLEEMSLYHRRDNGRITEDFDDLIDANRYLIRNRYSLGYRDGTRPEGRGALKRAGGRRPGGWRSR